MTATLADYWPALCPVLPVPWDTPANRDALAHLASRLAPIPRVALECRLDVAAPRLDLQQCIRRERDEPALLRDFVAAAGTGDAWARLHDFCTSWADALSLLHHGVAEVFLEYDLESGAVPALVPSLFFAVVDGGGEAVTSEALRLLLPASWAPGMSDNLARCFAACPAGASISYVGAMLGRAAQAVRVNVKRLRLEELAPFLATVGWRGSLPAIEPWAAWAYDRVDRVTVCLDVGAEIFPSIGFECVLGMQPTGEPRWAALLEELCGRALCTEANAGALLSVPGVLQPGEAKADWPLTWIVDTLRAPTDHFSTTERQLSHLKLTVVGNRASLKGYWGAGHVWRKPRTVAVDEAVETAVAFLTSRQSHTGRWSDFLLPAGPSDEWVTAFVAACLLETPVPTAKEAARRAWQALLRRRADEPGWGYNRLTPSDADSTAWALRLGSALGVAGIDRVAAARAFLADHQLPGGGITTYAARDPIRRYTRLPEATSFAGWQAPHSCVTAAAAPFVGDTAVKYLAGQQRAAGHWEGYWWWDDEYATALAAEACATGLTQAVEWAQARVGPAGAVLDDSGHPSPWATAWGVRILQLAATPRASAACRRAVQWLLFAQRSDGSWDASARLRVPMPEHVDADGSERTIDALDENRLFTTAAVVAALSLAGRS